MAAFLVLIASIAIGVLASRWYAKKGYGKGWRRTAGITFGTLSFLVLLLAFVLPSGNTGQTSAASTATAGTSPSPAASTPVETKKSEMPPVYTSVTPEARAAAKRYIATLDAAIASSIKQLPGIDIRTAAGISRYFNKLQARGEQLFGASISGTNKLWRCGAAGTFAAALWRSRILWSGSPQKAVQQVVENKQTYDTWRQYCLDAADGEL